ncbi:glycosyl transferase [Marinobacterium zhoushanense]|uniref:Glycosyl transferase n=1 Tax=Marinobacterium zhoushanense TaxID=1679163 RepID=A0ABQ1KEB7_9GAMM|nr:glycosyltransferase [Marinobacterium zhoushanense]GGB97407.1 glycosyl transferase [Marinobacterium zhoushanense]
MNARANNNNKPLRLMQLMLSSQNGGAETFFEKLTLALADAGVQQCVVIEPDPRRESLFAGHPNLEVKLLRFRGLHEPLGRVRLNLLMRRWQPDAMLTWMSRAIKRAPTGYCPLVARLGGYYRVERYRKSDRLIGNTPDIVRYLQAEGIPAEKAQYIPNFGELAPCELDAETARTRLREELKIPAAHHILLALGRLHEAKAHDTLIDALSKTENTTLLIAGDGPLKAQLEEQIEHLGLNTRAHLLGWRQDTGYLFKACDIAVFPSRFEPFGNVVVESWAQRRPLIAAASAGPGWLISDNVDGLLVPIDDSDELAAAINRLIADPALGERLVEAGYHTYREKFSREAVTEAYIKMFTEVIGRYHRR